MTILFFSDKKQNIKIVLVFLFIFTIPLLSFYTYNFLTTKKTQNQNLVSYTKKQTNIINNFEKDLENGLSISDYMTQDKVYILLQYANALTRQSDFTDSDRALNTQKSIDIYGKIANSNLENKYKVFALNEMYTAYIQSGSNIAAIEKTFSSDQVEAKRFELGFKKQITDMSAAAKTLVYQNLMIDKEVESVALVPTKIAIARISMQDYLNHMLYRLRIDRTLPDAMKKNEEYKQEFSKKVIENYVQYKLASANTLQPDTYYQVEAAYQMAWTLNRAGIYSNKQDLVEESYRMFEENISLIDELKKTSNDFWHLSIINKVFYATAVLGSNKDAYIDPAVESNRAKALSILSELSSSEFLSEPKYFGARNYLTRMKDSDMDWVTVPMILAGYSEDLKKNLAALGWHVD